MCSLFIIHLCTRLMNCSLFNIHLLQLWVNTVLHLPWTILLSNYDVIDVFLRAWHAFDSIDSILNIHYSLFTFALRPWIIQYWLFIFEAGPWIIQYSLFNSMSEWSRLDFARMSSIERAQQATAKGVVVKCRCSCHFQATIHATEYTRSDLLSWKSHCVDADINKARFSQSMNCPSSTWDLEHIKFLQEVYSKRYLVQQPSSMKQDMLWACITCQTRTEGKWLSFKIYCLIPWMLHDDHVESCITKLCFRPHGAKTRFGFTHNFMGVSFWAWVCCFPCLLGVKEKGSGTVERGARMHERPSWLSCFSLPVTCLSRHAVTISLFNVTAGCWQWILQSTMGLASNDCEPYSFLAIETFSDKWAGQRSVSCQCNGPVANDGCNDGYEQSIQESLSRTCGECFSLQWHIRATVSLMYPHLSWKVMCESPKACWSTFVSWISLSLVLTTAKIEMPMPVIALMWLVLDLASRSHDNFMVWIWVTKLCFVNCCFPCLFAENTVWHRRKGGGGHDCVRHVPAWTSYLICQSPLASFDAWCTVHRTLETPWISLLGADNEAMDSGSAMWLASINCEPHLCIAALSWHLTVRCLHWTTAIVPLVSSALHLVLSIQSQSQIKTAQRAVCFLELVIWNLIPEDKLMKVLWLLRLLWPGAARSQLVVQRKQGIGDFLWCVNFNQPEHAWTAIVAPFCFRVVC